MHIIAGLSKGGAETVLYRLILNDPLNTHFVISLTDDGYYGELLRECGARVVSLEMPRGQLSWKGLTGLWNAARSWPADVIQTWMYHSDFLGGLLGRLLDIPVVWGIRTTVLENDKSPRSTIWLAKLCAALSRRLPARIVTCAQSAARLHIELGYDAERIAIIPNGYDLTKFIPDTNARERLRTEWSIVPSRPLIGMVARYDPYKDHGNLINALAYVHSRGGSFLAVLAGSDINADNASLVGMIRQAGLSDHIRLLGARHDIPEIMSALDLHVLSSSTEGFPNVLAEAMACGTPCVTTDVGDARQIVGRYGWVVPRQNPEELGKAILNALSLCNDREKWIDTQDQCRQRIEQNYAMKAMVSSYHSVWSDVSHFQSQTDL